MYKVNQSQFQPTRLIQFIAWLNIILQLLLPVMLSITPTTTSANQHSVKSVNFDPQPVANKQLGQPLHRDLSPNSLQPLENTTELANLVANASQFLQNNPNSDAYQNYLVAIASNQANAEIERWLKQFGNAQINLGLDKYLTLKNIQFTLFMPLWENEHHLVFTQNSLHRTDSRTQSNVGIGWRYFTDNAMWGSNTFWDHDWSHHHSRLGIGVEYWRDYFKLSYNGYLPLSNWQNSPDLEDYKERAAKGWDIRIEGYLPTYPQLGANIAFEQYYGRDVALFNKDKRQADPYAVTAGLSYTPFPLVQLGAEHKQGKSGQNDNRFTIQFNYQIGVPWAQQISPDAVAPLRMLANNHYDFVNRNNNIVLEYQKQDVIQLHAPQQISGFAGQQKSLQVSVTSKHSVDRIDWVANALIANGGAIIQNSATDYSVILPSHQSQRSTINQYTISGIAYDKKGNRSNQVNIQIIVTHSAISVPYSSLTPDKITLPADGKTTQNLMLVIKDDTGKFVDLDENDISIQTDLDKQIQNNQSDYSISHFSRQNVGTYLATITTGTQPGVVRITPSTAEATFMTATVTFVADNSTARVMDVQPAVGPYIADGQSEVVFMAMVRDAYANPIAGIPVDWYADKDTSHVKFSATQSITDSQGIAKTTIISDRAYAVAVTATANATYYTANPIMFTASGISENESILTLTPTTIIAGKETAQLTLTLLDKNDNLISGQTVIGQSDNPDVMLSASNETIPGHYTIVVSGTQAGRAALSVVVNGHQFSQTKNLTITSDTSSWRIQSIVPNKTSIIAGEPGGVTYQAVIEDSYGNRLPDTIVSWQLSGAADSYVRTSRTNNDGIATTTVTSKSIGQLVMTVYIDENNYKTADVVTVTPGGISENTSVLTLTPAKIVAGKETAQLTLTLRDENNNLVSGQNVIGQSNNQHVTLSASNETSPGHYTIAVSGTQAGTASLSVVVNGHQFLQTKNLSITSDTSSWRIQSIAPDKTSMLAGELSGVTYRAVIVDGYGNQLPDAIVSWQLLGEADSYAPITHTDNDGIATTTVISKRAGKLLMTAYIDENNHKAASVVTVNPGDINLDNSTFSVDKSLIGSDGIDPSILTVTLSDNYGNAIPGKSIAIDGVASLAGFKVAPLPLKDNGDGSYQANATATSKGKVTLRANTTGKMIGAPITITVGAIKPNLTFDNKDSMVVYTKNFKNSQKVNGMPSNVTQTWSSSEPAVASVDAQRGNITLHKSGTTTITVYTPGNAQYSPAMASYNLSVNKADPQLNLHVQQIIASWQDGKHYLIKPTFDNSDVDSTLITQYNSQDPHIAMINQEGSITAVKPGNTIITVSTAETAQFKASTQSAMYILNKGVVNLSFPSQTLKMTDENNFKLQSPTTALPADANYVWSSSDDQVVNLTPQGLLNNPISKGKTRITLDVLANDYYQASMSYYDLLVYTKPKISLNKIKFGNNGQVVELAPEWTPVYKDDYLTVMWAALYGSEFDKITRAKLEIKDNNGNVLDTFDYHDPAGIMETRFVPKASYFNKHIQVLLTAYGYDNLSTSLSSLIIDVNVISPDRIGAQGTTYQISYRLRSGATDYSCQETAFGRPHHVVLNPATRIILPDNKELIAGVNFTIAYSTIDSTGDSRNIDLGSYAINQSGTYGYSGTSRQMALKDECWTNHYGSGTLKTTLTFAGKQSYSLRKFGWTGLGEWH